MYMLIHPTHERDIIFFLIISSKFKQQLHALDVCVWIRSQINGGAHGIFMGTVSTRLFSVSREAEKKEGKMKKINFHAHEWAPYVTLGGGNI